jgi:hypothetical protein
MERDVNNRILELERKLSRQTKFLQLCLGVLASIAVVGWNSERRIEDLKVSSIQLVNEKGEKIGYFGESEDGDAMLEISSSKRKDKPVVSIFGTDDGGAVYLYGQVNDEPSVALNVTEKTSGRISAFNVKTEAFASLITSGEGAAIAASNPKSTAVAGFGAFTESSAIYLSFGADKEKAKLDGIVSKDASRVEIIDSKGREDRLAPKDN